jgi:glycosyltransferase involved in cell wall biosynthesis
MLRVLHVSAAAERGGVEVILLNIIKYIDRTRFSPKVLFLTDGPFVREVEAAGVEAHVIEAGRVRQIIRGSKAVGRTARLIREDGIDLVHSHNAKAHLYGGMAAVITGVPSLLHLHGVPRFAFSRDGFLSLLSMAVPARRIVACSAYVAGAFKSAWHSRRQVTIVHNGLAPGVSSVQKNPAVRREFGISDEAPLVLMASRLQRQKGVHVFLNAVSRVARSFPEARFLVVGGALFGLEQDYPIELQQQVDSLKLNEAVRLVGFRSDIMSFYYTADIVVNSSIEPESFPTVLLEAMACSKPVIASDSGGSREIVDPGVTGLLVPPRDSDELAEAIISLLGDHDRRLRMGEAGAARVRDHLNAEHMIVRLQNLYEEMRAGVKPNA